MKKVWGVVCVLVMSFTLAGRADAQTQITTGVIQGTVSDPTGAVVPGADVEVRNIDTNYIRKLTTDTDGRFIALLLPPGRYKVTITKEGFATYVQEDVILTVGQTITLSISMKLGATAETITVTGTPTIETVKTEAASTLNEITVGTTPILGRKFEDLLTLTPGVSIVQGPDGDEINFHGQRGIFNNISLDGGDYINGFFGEQAGGQRAAVDITLDAVKEFQVISTGGSAEYGRTAGGIVNVITKSGTNEFHGSLYHFQRAEALTSEDSLGRALTDFHREQSGGTLGGPIIPDKAFWFVAVEQINGNLQRPNLSVPVGTTACPITGRAPVVTPTQNDSAAINANPECQRQALLDFIRTTRNQEEGLPVRRPVHNTAVLGKFDWNLSERNSLNLSYNFNRSIKINETFDVDLYGNSANGIEGPSRIQVVNFNLISTLTPNVVSECHFTYNREKRPRQAVASNVPADTAMGFANTFRFGFPFFLNPDIDEIFWRTQIRENISWVLGKHTLKFGGEWVHSLNDQIFRGFFTGRYIFDSVVGYLRYAAPTAAGGFGPSVIQCTDGTYITTSLGEMCPTGASFNFGSGPLLLYLQGAGRTGPATDAAGASKIDNEEYAIFLQDKWHITRSFTLNYGLRWEAQILPNPVVPPAQTAYAIFLNDPNFPSDGTLPSQKKMFQPRVAFAWDAWDNGKSVLRASWGIYFARQNMLSQVGSITANGVQQQTIFRNSFLIAVGLSAPTWPGLVTPAAGSCTTSRGTNPFPCFTGVRVFNRDYQNPRAYSTSVGYEYELFRDTAIYADFTHIKGVHLTRFINFNFSGIFGDELGEVMTASALGKSLYRGVTLGMRKRFRDRYQFEWNYVYSKDYDDDSNERDPFTDRVCDHTNRSLDYALSDRDIAHKFNLFSYAELPGRFNVNVRAQARSAQPQLGIVTAPNCGTRNNSRKDTEFFSFDWRLERPFKIGERFQIIPVLEMFNTFNNKNNINPLVTPGLFDFNGFLRQGVGDPRQVQVAFKITW